MSDHKSLNWVNHNITFNFLGRVYKLFCHTHNCGWPPFRMTERSVELALADEWLTTKDNVIEIGAVTPYYWPKRISNVVDPTDSHELVNIKASCLMPLLRTGIYCVYRSLNISGQEIMG